MNLFVNYSICLLACCPVLVCRAREVDTFSYSPVTWARPILVDYRSIATKESILENAQEQERLGHVVAAKAIRAGLGISEGELNSLPDGTKTVLAHMWTKASKSECFTSMSFGVRTLSGEITHDITALSIYCVIGEKPGETYPADAVINDICTFEKLTHLSLVQATLQPESFRKLTLLRKLEYLNVPVNITDEMLNILLREIPSLRCVELHGCKEISGAFARDREAAKNLSEITLIRTGIKPHNLVEIMTLPSVQLIALEGMNLYIDALTRDVLKR